MTETMASGALSDAEKNRGAHRYLPGQAAGGQGPVACGGTLAVAGRLASETSRRAGMSSGPNASPVG